MVANTGSQWVNLLKISDYGVSNHKWDIYIKSPSLDPRETSWKKAEHWWHPKVRESCCKILSSGHDAATALMNSMVAVVAYKRPAQDRATQNSIMNWGKGHGFHPMAQASDTTRKCCFTSIMFILHHWTHLAWPVSIIAYGVRSRVRTFLERKGGKKNSYPLLMGM